jgi:hypothetical protein
VHNYILELRHDAAGYITVTLDNFVYQPSINYVLWLLFPIKDWNDGEKWFIHTRPIIDPYDWDADGA